jgi:hypothetical protein
MREPFKDVFVDIDAVERAGMITLKEGPQRHVPPFTVAAFTQSIKSSVNFPTLL